MLARATSRARQMCASAWERADNIGVIKQREVGSVAATQKREVSIIVTELQETLKNTLRGRRSSIRRRFPLPPQWGQFILSGRNPSTTGALRWGVI